MYLLPLGHSCHLQTIMQSDLVGCDSPLQIVVAIWKPFSNLKPAKWLLLRSAGGCHGLPSKFTFLKSVPNGHYYLQRAVTFDWMGSIVLREHITAYFSWAEKHSEDKNSSYFLMNKKLQLQQEYGDNKQKDQQQLQVHQQHRGSQQQQEGNVRLFEAS